MTFSRIKIWHQKTCNENTGRVYCCNIFNPSNASFEGVLVCPWNIYIVCEMNLKDLGYDDYPLLENSLFGVVKLVKSADIDKYKYSGYGIGFDKRETFSVPGGSGRRVIIFVVDMSFFVYIGSGTMQELKSTTHIAGKSIQSIL